MKLRKNHLLLLAVILTLTSFFFVNRIVSDISTNENLAQQADSSGVCGGVGLTVDAGVCEGPKTQKINRIELYSSFAAFFLLGLCVASLSSYESTKPTTKK